MRFLNQKTSNFLSTFAKMKYAQKDFALAIQNRQDKSFFFLLRKFGPEKLSEARTRISEQLKKQNPIKEFAASSK